jgi:hypothetical protein
MRANVSEAENKDPKQNLTAQNIPRLRYGLLLVALFLSCCLGPRGHAADVLDEISGSSPADRNLTNALQVLRTQLEKTRAGLPRTLTNEFEQSLALRLKTIQEGGRNNIVPEYKSAMMAKRILELSENVLSLPYRKIPDDAEQRKRAQQQYAAALDRFEKAVPDKLKHLDDLSQMAIIRLFREALTNVQHDVFRPGYGSPLNEQESAELNAIIDKTLQAASALPAASDKQAAVGLSTAGKLANDGWRAILKFLRDREAGLREDQSFVAAFVAWRKQIAKIEQAVDGQLEKLAQAEIKAVQERAREQGEKDLRENDPNLTFAFEASEIQNCQ